MSLKFDGNDIPGEHGSLVFGAPEIVRRTVKFSQVKGEGEVSGEVGGRNIAVVVVIHDDYTTEAKLQTMLNKLSSLVSINGTLEEASDISGGPKRSLDFCTFDGWEPIPFDGQESPGPVYDVASTLDSNGGWFIKVLLRFRQLRWN